MRWIDELEQEFGPARDYEIRLGRSFPQDQCIVELNYPCEQYQGVGLTYQEALEDLRKKVRGLEWKGKQRPPTPTKPSSDSSAESNRG